LTRIGHISLENAIDIIPLSDFDRTKKEWQVYNKFTSIFKNKYSKIETK
jgi:hypothetical protein